MDSFTFKANDGKADSNTATVSITVNSVNDAPVADDKSVTMDEDSAVAITLTALDVDGDALTYNIVTPPNHGSLSGTAPDVIYTPESDYNGADSFTFTADDGTVDSNEATVSITVNALNDAPDGKDDTYVMLEDDILTIIAPGVMANDDDKDNDTLTAVLLSSPSNGTLTFNPDGSLTYSPASGFNGSDNFTYKVNDGTSDSGAASVTISVTSVNDIPAALNDFYSTDEDKELIISSPGILGNDTDFEGDALTAILMGNTSHGSMTLNADGSFTYLPDAEYSGTDSFTYKANDSMDDSNLATVTITVVSVNDNPKAGNEEYTIDEDTTLDVPAPGVLSNVTDSDGDPMTAVLVADATFGSVTLNADGSFIYTPNTNFSGNDSFTFKANDGSADSNVAMVTIHVNPINDAPELIGVPHEATADELAAMEFDANATDPDSPAQILTFSLIDAPSGASIDPSNGIFRWTPSKEQGPGNYAFKVRVTDDGTPALFDEETVTIAVNEVNSPPTIENVPDTVSIDELSAYTFNASAIDTDLPPQTLTFSLTNAPSGATIDPVTGAFTWTPTEAQGPGDYTFKVMVADSGQPQLYGEKTTTITVRETNSAPILIGVPMTASTSELAVYSFDADATDPDIPVQMLTYSITSAPSGASIDPATGVFTWSPIESQGPGNYSFKVRVTDNGVPAMHAEKDVTITVSELNSPPNLASPGNQSISWGNLLTLTLSAVDNDVPGNILTFSISNGSLAGMTLNPGTGEFAWTPTADQIGTHSVTFRVTDNGSPSFTDEKTIVITVGKRSTMVVYNGETSDQYSDIASLSANLTDASGGPLNGSAIPGKSINFTLGSQNTSATTNDTGLAAAELSLLQSAANYTVTTAFDADAYYLASSDADAFTIYREDTYIEYSGDNLGLTGANLTLQATIWDSSATGYNGVNSETGPGASKGDITKIWIAFDIFPAGSCGSGTPTTKYARIFDTGTTGDGMGTATTTFTSSAENSYCVIARLVNSSSGGTNEWYASSSQAQAAGIAFYNNVGQFVTGGGWITDPNGKKGNFGFNARFNKKGQPQGQMVYVYRGIYNDVQADFIIKSNALSALSFSGTAYPLSATLQGKCTIQINKSSDGTQLYSDGNATFVSKATDSGKSSGIGWDSFELSVWDKNKALYKSVPSSLLSGGNIVVHQK
jgi:VCBS repeat-containing protein